MGWDGPAGHRVHHAPGRGAELARDPLADYIGLLQCDRDVAYKGSAAKAGGAGAGTDAPIVVKWRLNRADGVGWTAETAEDLACDGVASCYRMKSVYSRLNLPARTISASATPSVGTSTTAGRSGWGSGTTWGMTPSSRTTVRPSTMS